MLKKRRVSAISDPDQPVHDDPDYVVPEHAKPIQFQKIKDKTKRAAQFAKVGWIDDEDCSLFLNVILCS